MTLPLIVLPAAQAEFDDAADWYESQEQGRGLAFVARVHETFNNIAAAPRMYTPVAGAVRRARVHRFTYSIIYEIESEQITVIAVFHGRRNPRIWQSRL